MVFPAELFYTFEKLKSGPPYSSVFSVSESIIFFQH